MLQFVELLLYILFGWYNVNCSSNDIIFVVVGSFGWFPSLRRVIWLFREQKTKKQRQTPWLFH